MKDRSGKTFTSTEEHMKRYFEELLNRPAPVPIYILQRND